MEFRKDECGQGQSLGIIIMLVSVAIGLLVLAVVLTIGPVVGYNIENSVVIPLATAASGTLTLTGNSTCAEFVNITNAAGAKVWFYINVTETTCVAPPAGVAVVSVTNNTSTITAINLTAAINNNATISGTMTATNPSLGVVTLTYDSTGTTGNTVVLVETAANGSWSASTLTGGVDGNNWNSQQNTNMLNGSEIWVQDTPLLGSAAIVVIAGVIISILLGVFMIQRRG